VRKSKRGHRLLFSIWHRHWQLPECLHHADSGGAIHRFARVALPACKTPIKAYDNVPVFAWLWLGGSAGHAGSRFRRCIP